MRFNWHVPFIIIQMNKHLFVLRLRNYIPLNYWCNYSSTPWCISSAVEVRNGLINWITKNIYSQLCCYSLNFMNKGKHSCSLATWQRYPKNPLYLNRALHIVICAPVEVIIMHNCMSSGVLCTKLIASKMASIYDIEVSMVPTQLEHS